MVVVARASLELIPDQAPRGVQSSTHFYNVGRPLSVPSRFLVSHPLHANGTANLSGYPGGLKNCIFRGTPAIALRTLHIRDPNSVSRHLEKCGNAGSHAVRF